MTAACLLIMILSSDVYTDFYEQGNTAYRAGEYADAIRSYEQLAASGVWNEEVYFNLGNAYYHQGPRKAAGPLWILAGLCAVALAVPPPPIQSAVVTAHEAPLRYGPDLRDPVRDRLAAGDRVLVDRVEGAWARVETAPGERGWLDLSEIVFAGPPFAHPVTDREQFSQ